MNSLPQVAAPAVAAANAGGEAHVQVALENAGTSVALAAKLTLLLSSDGERILPAYFSDKYISLLPGEKRTVVITYPQTKPAVPAALTLRGWNVVPAGVEVK